MNSFSLLIIRKDNNNKGLTNNYNKIKSKNCKKLNQVQTALNLIFSNISVMDKQKLSITRVNCK